MADTIADNRDSFNLSLKIFFRNSGSTPGFGDFHPRKFSSSGVKFTPEYFYRGEFHPTRKILRGEIHPTHFLRGVKFTPNFKEVSKN